MFETRFLTFIFSSVLQATLYPIFLQGHIQSSDSYWGDSEQLLAFSSYKSYGYSCDLTGLSHFHLSALDPPILIGSLDILLLLTSAIFSSYLPHLTFPLNSLKSCFLLTNILRPNGCGYSGKKLDQTTYLMNL